MDAAAPRADITATATDCIVKAVIDQYDVPDTCEEREFVTTTTRQVIRWIF